MYLELLNNYLNYFDFWNSKIEKITRDLEVVARKRSVKKVFLEIS